MEIKWKALTSDHRGSFIVENLIGEGVVWMVKNPEAVPHNVLPHAENLVFKVKGKKHSDTHTKSTAEVDVEKVANARAFADAVCTEHRLEKMVQKLKEEGTDIDIKNTGSFLKLVGQDVIKEETDRLEASELDWRDVSGAVNIAAKQYWMKLVNTL